MGPIQTALNKLTGIISGGIIAGRKLYERQAGTSQDQEAEAEEQKINAEKAASGEEKAKETLNSAYKTAQKKGLARIQNLIFDDSGEAIASYNEMASLLSNQALSSTLDSKKATRAKIKARKLYLEEIEGGKK